MSLLQQMSDEKLLSLLKNSDEAAFTVIYDRYWQKLYTLAMCKVNSLETAEEIVQDIFCSLWLRRETLQIQVSLASYLVISVKYRVIKVLDKHYKQKSYINTLLQSNIADNSTQEHIFFNELKEQLDKYTLELPEKCRLVFQLSREKGHSQKQIADELQISEKTVEAHLSKALKHLRSRLAHFFHLLL